MSNVSFLNSRTYSEASDPALHSGGGGGTYDGDMERRVTLIEDEVRQSRTTLMAMRDDLSYLRGALERMPNAQQIGAIQHDLGELKGRVARLPTLTALGTLIGIVAAFVALLPKIQGWISHLPF